MLNCYCQLSSSVIFRQYGVSQSECKIDRPRPGLPRVSPRPHIEALGTRLMYNALVIPNFYYCSTVWNDGYKSKLTKLSKLQKKAARVITGAAYDVRSNVKYFENLIGCRQSIKAYLFEKILLLLKHLLLILRIISQKCLISVQTKRTT